MSNLVEVPTSPQGSDLLTTYISKRLVESPVQSMVFSSSTVRFIDKNRDFYESNNPKVTMRIAQLVGNDSEAKNISIDGETGMKSIKLYRSFEKKAIRIYDANNYEKLQETFMEEWLASYNAKIQFLPSFDLQNKLAMFKQSEVANIGLHMAARQFWAVQAKQNSLLSTGKWFYNDLSFGTNPNTPIFDSGVTPQTVTNLWSDIDASTPLTDLDNAFQAMIDKQQQPTLILMGTNAATYFERNKKEVLANTVQVGTALNFSVQNPDVTLTRSMMNVAAGYRQVGSYKGVPIYCITKKLTVPNTTLSALEETVETFNANSVSIISNISDLGLNNFSDVYGNLAYFESSENNNITEIRDRKWFVYFGGISDDKTQKTIYCESKHAPVIENSDALYILNVA